MENETPIGEVIKKKKDKKKAKKERLLAELERKRNLEDSQDGGQVKKIKYDNVFEAQKAKANPQDNAQSAELRTYLAGQIARALAVFRIDEVIIFNDENSDGGGNSQLENILKYLECPQYLRKDFFPIHRDLKFAGVLNPTDMPHHLRAFEESLYREGIVKDHKSSSGNCVAFIGLQKECELDKQDLQAGLRVTVKLLSETKKGIKGQVVTPRTPCEENGLYWGYKVRSCSSLSSVFTKSPYKGGYDFTIGTSERGQDIDQVGSLRDFKHLLIVFGGVKGLEAALQVDSQLKVEDPEPLFDLYLNTCPDQGSRTIRSEEAILISLSALRPKIWNSSAE